MARKDNKGRNLHTGESQRKDGTYMYRYINTIDNKRQTVYANSLSELRQKEKQIQKDLDDDIMTDSAAKKLLVNTLFENYMETKELSENTRINYVNMWKNHARETIGNLKVVQLRSSHIKAFYAKMSRTGYSHSTIKLIHSILYPALEMAVDDDIIRKNPARNTLGDYGEKMRKKEVLTLEQQKKLLEFVRESNVYNIYIPMLTLMLEVGLRCGELIGLTWSDVDLKKKEVFINHQLIYKNFGNGYGFHATTPKTEAGIRVIPLSEAAYKALLEQKKLNFALGKHSTENIDGYSDFIFLAKTGRPLMPSAVNNVIYNIIDTYNKEEFERAKKEHRKAEFLPKISVHNLRHTACTNMARQGMNIKVLQYIMGHAYSEVTMDVYNHIADMEEVKKEILRCEKAVVIL